jgi:TPP-dependent pyruvate/acetoin dehydrogenase alpha subunit
MNHCTKEELVAFERRIADLWEAGELPYLIHLSGGNEDQLIEIFKEVQPGDWVFSTHRNHYHALLSGMSPARLEALIRRGQSMFVYEKHRSHRAGEPLPGCEVNFLTSSVLAGTCAIAAGVALEIRRQKGRSEREPQVWCFLGDGAEDEGHFYEAACFVNGHDLPCTFIIEDNDRSVDTSKKQRRGLLANEGTSRLPRCLRIYNYTPTYPHAGSGCKHTILFKDKEGRNP